MTIALSRLRKVQSPRELYNETLLPSALKNNNKCVGERMRKRREREKVEQREGEVRRGGGREGKKERGREGREGGREEKEHVARNSEGKVFDLAAVPVTG